jgi:chromosome partitioning protein
MKHILAFVSKKGGAGKTTYCNLLRHQFTKMGKPTIIRDYDSQGSTSKSLAIQGLVPQDEEKAQIIIHDTPPSLSSPATTAAISKANVILIPTSPSPYDLWECAETYKTVRTKTKVPCGIILTKVKQGTILSRDVKDHLKDLADVLLDEFISDRQCYQHAAIVGLDSLDAEAKEELKSVAKAILTLF